jgi:hypothetical protein
VFHYKKKKKGATNNYGG